MLDPKELEARRQNRVTKHKNKRRRHLVVPFLLVITAIYVAGSLIIPLPPLQLDVEDVKLSERVPVSIAWPKYGQAAVGAVGYGLLQESGEQKPLPMASIAKVVTAVAILKTRPMNPGDKPEIITLTSLDVGVYNRFLSEGQSVVAVEDGEQLTQYQALQALLLPSANNMADTLTRWAFGSNEEYLAFVNPFVATLGMTHTKIADSSGFSSQTVSTAADLTKLAEIAMNNPVIAEIVGQQQADLPVAGVVQNYNNLLGQNGINGIKTGNTDEAGGCYLFSATRKIEGDQSVTVVGAIMGAPNRAGAIADALPLIDEAFKNFKVMTPIQTNQIVGKISDPGGANVPVKVKQGVTSLEWTAQEPKIEVVENALSYQISQGSDVGKLKVHIGNMVHEATLVADGTIKPKSMLWRIRHAGGYL